MSGSRKEGGNPRHIEQEVTKETTIKNARLEFLEFTSFSFVSFTSVQTFTSVQNSFPVSARLWLRSLLRRILRVPHQPAQEPEIENEEGDKQRGGESGHNDQADASFHLNAHFDQDHSDR
jgi:hypothetical protein